MRMYKWQERRSYSLADIPVSGSRLESAVAGRGLTLGTVPIAAEVVSDVP